jgi:hypothetical protein
MHFIQVCTSINQSFNQYGSYIVLKLAKSCFQERYHLYKFEKLS